MLFVYSLSRKYTCDALRDLVPFVQFKKRENTHGGVVILVKLQASTCNFTKSNTPPWVLSRFLNCTRPITSLKITLLHECFSSFLNCTNGTKSHKATHREVRRVSLWGRKNVLQSQLNVFHNIHTWLSFAFWKRLASCMKILAKVEFQGTANPKNTLNNAKLSHWKFWWLLLL